MIKNKRAMPEMVAYAVVTKTLQYSFQKTEIFHDPGSPCTDITTRAG